MSAHYFQLQQKSISDYVTELTIDKKVNPETFANMAKHFSEREICEIVYLVASEYLYNLTNTGLNIHSDIICDIVKKKSIIKMKSIFKLIPLLTILLTARITLFSQAKTMQPTTSNKEIKAENQSNDIKEYILLVRLPLDYGPDKAREVREQWNVLLDKWKASGIYVASFAYPNDGYLVTGTEKTVTNEKVVSSNFSLVNNMILRAKDYDAALLLAKECPVLAQGGIIEVREIQPRPKSNQQIALNHTLYAIRYSPGEMYDSTKSVYQQDLKEHGLYMKQLSGSGKLFLAGPFINDAGGMLILNVTDEMEAIDIVSKDPAVLKNIFNYKMNIWNIKFKTVKF